MSQKTKKYKLGKPPNLIQRIYTSNGLMKFMVADFLKAIEKRPLVYNNYTKSTGHKGKVWKEIAVSLYPRFNELPEAEQHSITNRLKKNWRFNQILLLRSVHKKQMGDPKFKPYTFRKEMNFFIKFKNINIEDTKYSDEEDEEDVHEDPNMNDDDTGQSAFDPIFSCQTAANGTVDLDPSAHPQENISNLCRRAPPFIQYHSVHSVLDDGVDNAFFESIKPSLRKIGDSLKLDFKIDVLELLKKYQN